MVATFSSYASQTRRGRRRLIATTVLAIVLIALDLLTGGGIRSIVRSTIALISNGVTHTENIIFGSGYFVSHASLAAQNTALKDQIATLEEQAALTQSLKDQNQSLASLVHLAQTTVGITAPITSSFVASPYGTFLVGAGSLDGVTVGSIVVTTENVAVGKVSSLSPHVALVTLFLSSGFVVDATLDGASSIVRGLGSGNGKTTVPHGMTVHVGDTVLAPEYGNRPIAVVGHVDTDPSNAAVQVLVGLPVNLSSLHYLYITKQ